MESPNKRIKTSPEESDFVSLDVDENVANKFGYGDEISTKPKETTRHDRGWTYGRHDRRVLQDRRHAKDRPKEKLTIDGHPTWLLVKTKYGRKFVHNVTTKESFWRIPSELIDAVRNLDLAEQIRREKKENAQWAEEQLQQMRKEDASTKDAPVLEQTIVGRRRRSESLQREDEAALIRELNAEAETAADQDESWKSHRAKDSGPQAGDRGYDSDGESFEYVEVTDSEGEEEDAKGEALTNGNGEDEHSQKEGQPPFIDNGPVEFGEDDFAYQLAEMGEDYGSDPGENGVDDDGDWEEGEEDHSLADEDAITLFHNLLNDSGISPFTPWDNVIADETPTSIMYDERYTVLSNMKARKAAWDSWTKIKVAQIRAERAQMEDRNPRVAYLAFLSSKATPKLYWPEFKRKYKREKELSDRRMTDKDREKLYRDYISRLKLPESTRKADLTILLKSLPLSTLDRDSRLDSLPLELLTHLHFISAPIDSRDALVTSHIKGLHKFEKR